jgi:hypothetical protein
MPINTYVALDTKTISTATPTVVFTSIPQTYTDLILVSNTRNASGLDGGLTLQFNTDTSPSGTNYSTNFMYADGSNPYSSRHTNYPHVVCNRSNSSNWSSGIAHIMDYKNTTTNKSIVSRGSSNSIVIAYGGVWRATPQAITTITVGNEASVNFVVGSTFTLYGVANSNIGAPKAFGGTITQDANYTYHTFGASGTFTPQQSLTADILVIAGGGAGGAGMGGGGGAGGLLAYASQSLTATNYTVTVGAGGVGSTTYASRGANGSNSSFGGLTASVGGGGGGTWPTGLNTGGSGGSGGGAGGDSQSGSGTFAGGTATSGQGNAGGSGQLVVGSIYRAGGGGGAGGAGETLTSRNGGGDGGAGSSSYSSWASATGTGVGGNYAGGGGGGGETSGTRGTGQAGGANGGPMSGAATTNAVANTGSGGGGGGAAGANSSSSGGSGIVIIRYAK